MPLLAAIAHDPASAASASTATLSAMADIDAANIVLTFTVPSSGRVMVRLAGVITGATTYPQVLLGVRQGTTVVKRAAGTGAVRGTAVATTHLPIEATFIVTGLTSGASLTWKAAWGTEVAIAATAIRWGGPDNATTNDAWGAFCFEIWDVG